MALQAKQPQPRKAGGGRRLVDSLFLDMVDLGVFWAVADSTAFLAHPLVPGDHSQPQSLPRGSAVAAGGGGRPVAVTPADSSGPKGLGAFGHRNTSRR